MKSVKSINPCLAGRQACISVIQTTYDIVKAHGRELKVETATAKEREASLLFNYQSEIKQHEEAK